MKNTVRLFWFGFITWLIPFVVAFAFYNRQGELTTSIGLFKSVMVLVSGVTGCMLLYRYLSRVSNPAREGWKTGLVWLAINILLDLAILIPMSGMSLRDYVTTIALGYLLIPVICVTGGLLSARTVTIVSVNK